jgi:hypothetical protein
MAQSEMRVVYLPVTIFTRVCKNPRNRPQRIGAPKKRNRRVFHQRRGANAHFIKSKMV